MWPNQKRDYSPKLTGNPTAFIFVDLCPLQAAQMDILANREEEEEEGRKEMQVSQQNPRPFSACTLPDLPEKTSAQLMPCRPLKLSFFHTWAPLFPPWPNGELGKQVGGKTGEQEGCQRGGGMGGAAHCLTQLSIRNLQKVIPTVNSGVYMSCDGTELAEGTWQ